MLDLNKYLEAESNHLEMTTIQWLNKIEFRKEELSQQTSLITCSEPSTSNNQSDCGQSDHPVEWQSRDIRVRRPLLEVPTYSGQHREFSAFWSVFESLIHNDRDLTDTEKFLFLKQSLKGKAASTIHSIPVTGEKHHTAVNLLKKHFDKSASIADILITEIERLPRALENPSSCRETFDAISTRLIHLEQTGVPMNADRVRRHMILCKFPESICDKVIQKENEEVAPFTVNDIMTAIDDIITLRETTSLTTRALFGHEARPVLPSNKVDNKQRNTMERFQTKRLRQQCLCGGTHPPSHYTKYTTPDARRAEARRQKVCWKCFNKNHFSKDCNILGPCPKCSEPHHSSLCYGKRMGVETVSLPQPRTSLLPGRNMQQPPSRPVYQSQPNRSGQPYQRNTRDTTNVQANQNSTPLQDLSVDFTPTSVSQCVLQIASALIFNEADQDYQPITMLLDSGAQKSFIKSHYSEGLKLPIVRSRSFTTTGMGELKESFQSDEVLVTLKSLHCSRKLQRLSVHTKEKLTSMVKAAVLSEQDKTFIKDRNITIAQKDSSSSEVSPDLLIGQDLLNSIIDHNAAALKLPSGLMLTPTIFGYTISGNSQIIPFNEREDVHFSTLVVATPTVTSAKDDYKKDIKHLYELESLGLNISNDSHEAAMIKFMNTYRKSIIIDNGRITAGFPFTEDVAMLHDNFNVAFRRLQGLVRVLRSDTEKLSLYSDTLMDYLNEGITEDCSNTADGIATFYLPHRHVWTPSKSTKLNFFSMELSKPSRLLPSC